MSLIKKIKIQFYFFIAVLIFSSPQCEKIDRYYRPNTPEKISVVGIIDSDDTIRYISIEKSFQKEYPEKVNDSLRDLSFKIKSSDQVLYSFSSDIPIKNLDNLNIPKDIMFNSGQKYFIEASEKSLNEISSESTVPMPPSGFKIISVEKEIIHLSQSQECPPRSMRYKSTKYAVFNLTFDLNINGTSYYALLIEANGGKTLSSTSHFHLPIEFSIRESNIPGFFSTMKGFNGHQWLCMKDSDYRLQVVPVNLYFIDPQKAHAGKCNIKVSVKYGDLSSAVDFIRDFRIKLLSIPKELYLFEKSIASYNQSTKDPLSEPFYIEGNIKGGNGVFAICRSSTISILWNN